jgi:hypothetical protein
MGLMFVISAAAAGVDEPPWILTGSSATHAASVVDLLESRNGVADSMGSTDTFGCRCSLRSATPLAKSMRRTTEAGELQGSSADQLLRQTDARGDGSSSTPLLARPSNGAIAGSLRDEEESCRIHALRSRRS